MQSGALRPLLYCALLCLPPAVNACAVDAYRYRYVNVVRMYGPEIQGLKWIELYNILDYDGDEALTVSGLRNGQPFPIAKWSDGQVCRYAKGVEQCEPQQPEEGVYVQGYYEQWKTEADRKQELKPINETLRVETQNGRIVELTLRSTIVPNNDEMQSVLLDRITNIVCE